MRVGHHPRLWACRKIRVSRTDGRSCGGQHVPQHLPGADRGQLVDIPHQQQMRARRDRLDELVGQQQVQHRRLVHHHQVGVQRVVPVIGGVAARAQFQQPVHGDGRAPGQLGRVVSPPARSVPPRLFWRSWPSANVITDWTVKHFPQPGPPVSTATFAVNATSLRGGSTVASAARTRSATSTPTPCTRNARR